MGMPARTIIEAHLQVAEMAAATPATRASRYYHGTSNSAAGEKILAHGSLKRPTAAELDTRYSPRAHQRPAGGVYLTPYLKYATIYALGGVVMGINVVRGKDGAYGYLFVVDGAELTDVEPDEDVLGSLVWSLGGRAGSFAADSERYDVHSDHAPLLRALRADPAFMDELRAAFNRYVTPHTLARAEAGEASWQSMAGKQLLRHLSPDQRAKLVELGSHLSARQDEVRWTEAWRILKTDAVKLDRDGGNFFDVAERVA